MSRPGPITRPIVAYVDPLPESDHLPESEPLPESDHLRRSDRWKRKLEEIAQRWPELDCEALTLARSTYLVCVRESKSPISSAANQARQLKRIAKAARELRDALSEAQISGALRYLQAASVLEGQEDPTPALLRALGPAGFGDHFAIREMFADPTFWEPGVAVLADKGASRVPSGQRVPAIDLLACEVLRICASLKNPDQARIVEILAGVDADTARSAMNRVRSRTIFPQGQKRT